jgi:predicted ATPase
MSVKGEVLSLSTKADTTSAEDHFRRSLELARRHQALSWELRAAMSLGKLRHAQGRGHDARDLVNSVYVRFTEGFETADLIAARRLFDEWA